MYTVACLQILAHRVEPIQVNHASNCQRRMTAWIDNFSCDLRLGVYAESFVTSRSRSSSILPSRNRSSSHRRQTTLLCLYSNSCRSLKVRWATSGVSCLHAAPSLRFCLFRRNHADHDTLRYCPTPPFHADFSADAGLLTYPRRQKEVQP